MHTKHRFSQRATRIIALAKEAAREYEQSYVGTEHLLLGIIREGTGIGARILLKHGADKNKVKEAVDEVMQDRLQDTWILGRLPGTPNFRDVLARADERARGTGNWQICSAHLLQALLLERNSTGHKALCALGITADVVSQTLTANQVAS